MNGFKKQRGKAGLTQKETANKLGVHQTSVHFWESGKTAPRVAHLMKLMELYGCTIDDLFREHGK